MRGGSERPPAAVEKTRIRLVIESVFANLKGPDPTRRPSRQDRGLVQRIAQRLLALTLGMFCNLLAGRPTRALVACDGR
jgi:hypothetical protein